MRHATITTLSMFLLALYSPQSFAEVQEAGDTQENGPDIAEEGSQQAFESGVTGEEIPLQSTEAESAPTEAGDPESPEPPRAPSIIGIPGSALDVAFSQSVVGLHPGDHIEGTRSLAIPEGGCIRLVAELSAAVTLCGPARAEISARGSRVVLRVLAGQGLLSTGDDGGAVEIGDHHVEVRNGRVYFTTSGPRQAILLSGEGASLDGEVLTPESSNNEVMELLSPGFCAPPHRPLVIPLGDPTILIEESSQARTQAGEGGEEAATAESGATCVDSADSSSATDPNQGIDNGIDPDARRDEPGRLRLRIQIPR